MITEWKGDRIGVIRSAHGLKGELIISHELDDTRDVSGWDAFMIEVNPGSYIPFFIEEIEWLHGDEIQCKLEGIQSREEATRFNGKAVYSTIHYHVKRKKENEWDSLIGYDVYHKDHCVGRITGLVNLAMNVLFQLDKDGKEILIPATEEFIVGIHPTKNQIEMNLPEELLEL